MANQLSRLLRWELQIRLRYETPWKSACTALLYGADLLQNVFGEEVLYLGLIADDFVIGGLQQLLAAVAKLLTDGLLHARVLQLALSSSLFADETHYAVAEDLVTVWVGDYEHGRIL